MPNWDFVLREVKKERDDPSGHASAHDKVRRRYLMQLHELRGRNIIAYYSGFLTKRVDGIEITDEDKNGFMLCIHKLDRSKGLDLILHTPGGDVAATESLVDYLRKMFGADICAFVPQIAMSAGTMIACSCSAIFMGTHSNLGPVDPQIFGIPAYGVIQEVERAYNEIKDDNTRAFVWTPILSRYTPSFLQQCHWAVERTEEFVKAALKLNMLKDLPDDDKIAKSAQIFEQLFDLKKNKGHDKHFHAEDCKKIGLTVIDLEGDKALQDLVLTVHHCYMHTLANTAAVKLIENHVGRCYAKLVQQFSLIPGPLSPPPGSAQPVG